MKVGASSFGWLCPEPVLSENCWWKTVSWLPYLVVMQHTRRATRDTIGTIPIDYHETGKHYVVQCRSLYLPKGTKLHVLCDPTCPSFAPPAKTVMGFYVI
jgi:hypothetical protein